MKKAAILLNPSSGRGKALGQKDRFRRLLDLHRIEYEPFISQSEDDLRTLTRKTSKEYPIVVAAGGDGTFSIVAHEMIRNNAQTLLGLVNLGTRGDISRDFGTYTLERSCEAIKTQRYREVDAVALYGDGKGPRYFLGVASLGLETAIDECITGLVEKQPIMKELLRYRFVEFMVGIYYAHNIFKSRNAAIPLRITSEDFAVEGRTILTILNNTRHYDNGSVPSPLASPYDGKLDCCFIRDISFFRAFWDYILLSLGKHTTRPEVEMTPQAATFRVLSETGVKIQVDGEILGPYREIKLEVVPKALKVIVNEKYLGK